MKSTLLILDDPQLAASVRQEVGEDYEILDEGQAFATQEEALARLKVLQPHRILIGERLLPLVWLLTPQERARVVVLTDATFSKETMNYLKHHGVVHFTLQSRSKDCLLLDCLCEEPGGPEHSDE